MQKMSIPFKLDLMLLGKILDSVLVAPDSRVTD